ncbi:hypothetical protein [Caenispirillum bisanense]|nr:hypothetical protein [Caenispirillum bisanense]
MDDAHKLPEDLISQAEFARMRGVTRVTICNLVKKYGVPRYGAGKISLAEATRILNDNQQPNKQRMGQSSTDDPEDKAPAYNTSRAKREHYNALKAEAEYEKLVGNLVSRKAVEDAAAQLGNHLSNRIRDFSSSIADALAREKDPRKIKSMIDERLFEYINETADQLRKL